MNNPLLLPYRRVNIDNIPSEVVLASIHLRPGSTATEWLLETVIPYRASGPILEIDCTHLLQGS